MLFFFVHHLRFFLNLNHTLQSRWQPELSHGGGGVNYRFKSLIMLFLLKLKCLIFERKKKLKMMKVV